MKLKNPLSALHRSSNQGGENRSNAGEKTTLLPVSVGTDEATRSAPNEEEAIAPQSPTASEKGLTAQFTNSPSLNLCVACIVLYLCLAVLAFSVVFESWSIVDSLYYAVVTFTTIGYGDLSPSTTAGKSFAIAFALFGVAIVGVALGIVGEMVVEYQKEAAEKLRDGGKKRIMSMLKKKKEQGETNGLGEQEPEEKENTLWDDFYGIIKADGWFLLMVILCSLGIGYAEGWALIDSLYYCAITTTTIGYGDLTPSEESTRFFAVFFLPLAVVVLAKVLGGVAGVYLDRKARKAEKEFLRRELTMSDLAIMDENGDGAVQMGEFLSFMLVAMQKVSAADVDELKELFRELDADGGGTLQKEDLMILAQRKSARSGELA